ncbi:V-type ATP synthase subunit I [Methylomonas sp. HYX-M1]|uniref:V-type ATP synthase subunit I n=1 Tax=Methylomonas sp. HYX-M1 TaxID=3139307 RepID=UPI00345BB15E
MAIVALKKLSFCGLQADKVRVLQQLQALGELHLIPFEAQTEGNAPGQSVADMMEALRFLNATGRKRHQAKSANDFDLQRIVGEVLQLKAELRNLHDRYDSLQKRIQELTPWGDFQLPETGLPGGQRLWFYIVPKRLMRRMPLCPYPWQAVFQDNLRCYVVVISAGEPAENELPVARTHTGSQSLSVLRQQSNDMAIALEDMQAKRESYTRWIALMTLHCHEILNQAELQRAQAATRDTAGVFVLQAWLPADRVEDYRALAARHDLALLVEEPSEQDNPPTLLRNPAALAGGEDLVGFYQMPAYQGWDPSAAVFFSFSLFFAMILSDAGYALVFAGLLLFKWRRLSKTGKGRRLRLLAAVAVTLSLLWGILCGSYFGAEPRPDSIWAQLRLFDLNDFDGMMRLTIAVGVLHLLSANLISAWQNRHSPTALASVGWIALTGGGFSYWLDSLQPLPLLHTTGISLMVAGLSLLVLFSSPRALKTWRDGLWRVLDGLKSLIRISQLFGDVLSYMRLFALGLASASLALTFNRLAGQIMQQLPGTGLLFGILILLFGHGLNLALCLLSGMVHGLRLNFIEFYNWSVSDEGYPFKAFSKKESADG